MLVFSDNVVGFASDGTVAIFIVIGICIDQQPLLVRNNVVNVRKFIQQGNKCVCGWDAVFSLDNLFIFQQDFT